jgi:anaerobic ribonucleoside-triphosphate reductase activating protein
VVFQECPNEIALCFSFYGCPLRCNGCHSEELWNASGGSPLSVERFEQYLNQYAGLMSAVVFFGGEWQPLELQALLRAAQAKHLKTCLYTGLNHISRHLKPHLNFAKVGPWESQLGGVNNLNSNQRFYQLENNELKHDLTHLFLDQSAHIKHANHKDSYHAAA